MVYIKECQHLKFNIFRSYKLRANFSLCLIKHDTTKTNEGIAPLILNLDTKRRQVVRFTTRTFYPQGRPSPSHPYILDMRQGGPHRAGLDLMAKKKIPGPTGTRIPVVQLIA